MEDLDGNLWWFSATITSKTSRKRIMEKWLRVPRKEREKKMVFLEKLIATFVLGAKLTSGRSWKTKWQDGRRNGATPLNFGAAIYTRVPYITSGFWQHQVPRNANSFVSARKHRGAEIAKLRTAKKAQTLQLIDTRKPFLGGIKYRAHFYPARKSSA